MKHIERMTNLIGTPALRVMWAEKEDGKVCYDYRIVYYYDAYFTPPNPYKPKAIIYPVLNPTADVSYTDPAEYAYWDDKVNIIYDEHGKVVLSSSSYYTSYTHNVYSYQIDLY